FIVNKKLRVSKSYNQQTYTLKMECDQYVTDYFKDVKLNWNLLCRNFENLHHKRDIAATLKLKIRLLELTFHKKHQNFVLDQYIPLILGVSL
ncbi:hypothetical protein RYX36_025483, partial [Vicia faba]